MRRRCLLAVVLTLLAPAARGDEPRTPAPAFDCGVPPPPPPPAPPAPGVPAPPPFPRTAIALPPIVYATPNRDLWEVMLLYWQKTDAQANSRFRLLAPFYMSQCDRTGHSTITPVFGSRTDAAGT